MPLSDIPEFLDQCRQVQAQAAGLCQDSAGLSPAARDALKELRLSLLKARKMLGPAGDVADATLDAAVDGSNRAP